MIHPPYDDVEIIEINDLYIFTTKGEIPRNRFDAWLESSGALDWEKNTSDHTGEHVQLSGTYDIDEYYEYTPHSQILLDIIEYSRDCIKHIASQRKPKYPNRMKLVNLTKSFSELKTIMDNERKS